MLNQLPGISAPHPPHILKTFAPLLPRYGDIEKSENLNLLTSDVCRWVNANPVSWSPFIAEPRDILNKMTIGGLPGIFAAIGEAKAISDGADSWCCKSMESVSYTSLIEDCGLRPIYIYLYRDGRDVALSFMKAIVGPKHIYNLAVKWKEEQQLALNLKEQVSPERFVAVQYERLVANPESELRRLCDAIGESFSVSMLKYFDSAESIRTADAGKMWENLGKPIMKDNFKKFLSGIPDAQLLIFEQVAGNLLQKLGYDLVTHAVPETGFTEEQYLNFEEKEKKLQQLSREQASPADLERRLPQELILQEIIGRKPI